MPGTPFLKTMKANSTARLVADDSTIRKRFEQVDGLHSVATLLEVCPKLLRIVLYGTRERRRYTPFTVQRRNGTSRRIHAPPKNLKILQEKLARILSLYYRPKWCVHGFRSSRSIYTNADPHVRKRFILNIDLQDYFEYITIGRIIGALQQQPFDCSKQAATIFGQIATLDSGTIAQGAPCSPVIANIVSHGLDKSLTDLAQAYKCLYTRYADDITLSTNAGQFPPELAKLQSDRTTIGDILVGAVEEQGFAINYDKCRLATRIRRQEVTGLTVNEFANVPRKRVRNIRSLLHVWSRYGHAAAQSEFRKRTGSTATFSHHVRGKIAYLEMVRGRDDPIVRRLLRDLARLDPKLVGAIKPLTEIDPSPLRGAKSEALSWQEWHRRLYRGVFLLTTTTKAGDQSAGTGFRFS